MKATIVRPDGTRIEVEGTPEEIVKLAPPGFAIVPMPTCACFQFNSTNRWCPVHGYRWQPMPVIYGTVNPPNAAAGNALPVIWQA